MGTDLKNIEAEEIKSSTSNDCFKTISPLDTPEKSIFNVVECHLTYNKDDSINQSSTTLKSNIESTFSITPKQNSLYSLHINEKSVNKKQNISDVLIPKNICEKENHNTLAPQRQVLFNAPNYPKKLRKKAFSKQKCLKCTRLVKVRIVHFKSKHLKKNITKKLETYYDKTKSNCSNLRRIKQNLSSDSVLKAILRTRILKKGLAKENLLDEMDKMYLKNLINHKALLGNEPSQDTLVRINSELSQNDTISSKTVPSVIEINFKTKSTDTVPSVALTQHQGEVSDLSHKSNDIIHCIENNAYSVERESRNIPSFKRDIISVAIAQVTNASILRYNKGSSSEHSREEVLYKENLTSDESFMTQSDIVLTASPLEIEKDRLKNAYSNDEDESSETLTGLANCSQIASDSDTFVIAKSSSYFNKTDIVSNQTLTPSSDNDLINRTGPCNIYFQSSNKEEVKSTLLDTIINVGMFQHLPSNSSENQTTDKSNIVIITDELRKILPLNIQTQDKYSKNVIQKTFSVENDGDRHKSINIPNEDTIKTILTETEKLQKKSCCEEFRTYTPNTDVWDKLIIILDTAIKQMEDSLINKISNELKKGLDKFEKYFPFYTREELNFVNPEMRLYNKINESNMTKIESGELMILDAGTQCGLVQNNVIDDLIVKMNLEGAKTTTDNFPLKLIKNKVKIKKIEDYYEVLKSPVGPCTSTDRGNGDSLMTSSSEGVRVKNLSTYRRFVLCLTSPIYFLKTNMLVFVSVPAFILSVFLIYTFLVVIK